MMKALSNFWNQSIGPNHWRILLAVSGVYTFTYFLSHLWDGPYGITYAHLLVDYHFGLSKRSLIGAIVGLFTDKVPIWMVFAIGGVMLVAAFLLFLRLFQTTFGFSRASLPLAAFIFGSPFFFKHLIKSMGFFDIYGLLLALIVLLVPANSLTIVLLAGAGSLVLLFIHHLHMLLYIPVIAAIVIIRFYLVRRRSSAEKLVGVVFVFAALAIFLGLQFFGAVKATPETLRAYMESRMGSGGDVTAPGYFFVWFKTYSQEVGDTWDMMLQSWKYTATYMFLLAVHYPLARYFRDCIVAIKSAEQRRVVIALVAMILLGYCVIYATIFDYGRWTSSLVICMILMLHAVRKLEGAETAPMIPIDSKWAFRLGGIVTAIPRVGIIWPFY